ncbi:MAG TPA: right-handed parallel beta-helix repeat-containing protein, partial [Candidatus Sumerlaeota bacterium]|nr:right-handed parallel beta-helix repeat-containing protein [Candidatus Sumerlaeota bacterium]
MKKTMALVFFLSFFLCRIFPFGEIRVPADHVKINDAVQAASWGQTVQIDPGVYDGSTQDFPIFMKDGVSVEGAGTALTIIDNGGTGVPAIFAENMLTSASLMRSFTVRGGYLSAGSGAAMIIRNTVVLFITDVRFTGNSAPGAGAISIENANAYFRDCRFERNQGGSGGAISISGSSAPLFINCDFENNQAFASGGAIFVGTGANMEVNRSRFLDNLAGINGGAVYILSGGGALLDNVIQGNSASLGGGVYLGSPASSATIQRCVIRKNSALEGGGVYSAGGGIAIMANTISHNTAISNGAAYQASGATDDFLNNTIHHNICDGASGSTLLIQSSSMNAVNNTIAHNDCAQAVRLVNASPSIFNNIIAFNTGAGLFESGAASDPDCQYNLIHANPAGNYVDEGSIILNTAAEINSALNAPRTSQMNITGDPLFRDALAGDYHIRSSSPAREAATWLPPSFPEEDMDSDIRRDARCGTLPDAGADEFSAPVLVPPALYYDVNGDDEVTTGDLLVLTFSRPVDSPTTITAADFSLPVAFDTLGTNPRVIISPLNARQTIITLGGSPYLTVDDIYSDSAKDPGYPSGIDVAPPRPDGIQDEEGVPASPLGPPAGDPTGLDITRSIMTNSGYTSWYIGTIILAGAGSVFPATQL